MNRSPATLIIVCSSRKGHQIRAKHVIACAGLYSDRVAQLMGGIFSSNVRYSFISHLLCLCFCFCLFVLFLSANDLPRIVPFRGLSDPLYLISLQILLTSCIDLNDLGTWLKLKREYTGRIQTCKLVTNLISFYVRC